MMIKLIAICNVCSFLHPDNQQVVEAVVDEMKKDKENESYTEEEIKGEWPTVVYLL